MLIWAGLPRAVGVEAAAGCAVAAGGQVSRSQMVGRWAVLQHVHRSRVSSRAGARWRTLQATQVCDLYAGTRFILQCPEHAWRHVRAQTLDKNVNCTLCFLDLQVREAYRSKGWALLDVEKVEQCHHEG